MSQTSPNYPSETELRAQWRRTQARRIAIEEQGKTTGKRAAASLLVLLPSLCGGMFLTMKLLGAPLEGGPYTAPITNLTGLSPALVYMACLVLISAACMLPFMMILSRIERTANARSNKRLDAEGLTDL